MHPTRFGIQTGQQLIEWRDMLALWQRADAWGYHSLWNFDHFYPIFVDPEGPCLEGWTTLSALAQATRTARIGALVNGNTYRHPSLTAKMAASLDHISGGRLNLGIGAGWFELEHRQLGFDFKTVPQRLAALDEACQIIKGLLTQERTTLHGRHYQVTDAMGLPKPLQQPHPPILIGGTGEKVLLKLVARHADMWNASNDAAEMGRLIGVIARHCEAIGRDPATIEKTVLMPFAYKASADEEGFICNIVGQMRGKRPEQVRESVMLGGKDECLATVERYRRVGVTHFIFMLFGPPRYDALQAFAEEVLPAA
ncbi:MAG: LLM class F420-dependent oxidoreductase [Deltaproteobacteria bacterium]|nr:LLM class F420-dependent oxidoreductase [Deltaproteobacteria bacterium]